MFFSSSFFFHARDNDYEEKNEDYDGDVDGGDHYTDEDDYEVDDFENYDAEVHADDDACKDSDNDDGD